jgi:hypothetical protein
MNGMRRFTQGQAMSSPVLDVAHSNALRTGIAVCALLIGVAAYAFLRPHAAVFLPADWHRPQMHGLPTWLLGGLPTFVHTLAMALLTAIAIGSARVATLRAICAAWCAVEIGFELVQHAALRPALLAALPADAQASFWTAPFANFVRRGTFDSLDIAAALLATLVAYTTLNHRPSRSNKLVEARHA